MAARIVSIGTAVPPVRSSQNSLAEDVNRLQSKTDRERGIIRHLFNRAGVEFRYTSVLEPATGTTKSFFSERTEEQPFGPDTEQRMQRYSIEASNLATEASRKALQNHLGELEGLSNIEQLVTVSCTGFVAPGFDLALIKALNLNRKTGRTHIGFMGCHGALNGVRAARAFVEASPDKYVLLCATEICSLHFQYGFDVNSLVANSLFADGAAAMLLTSTDDEQTTEDWTVVGNYSLVVDDTDSAITWRMANNGFIMSLSNQLPQLIENSLPQFICEILASHELAVKDVQSWAIHPGGKKILDAVQRCLSLSNEQMAPSRAVLASYGNMSSATTLFILKDLIAASAPRPCLLIGFGPGMTIEAALLK